MNSEPFPATAPSDAQPELSLVVPVYDEQESVPLLWEATRPVLEALGRRWEAILVDDGSSDGSFEVMRKLHEQEPRVRVLRFRENRGQSAAMAAGFRNARGEWVVTMDADLQNDPRDIPLLLEKAGEFDLVAGWRKDRQDSFLRKLSSRIARWYRQRYTRDGVRDTGCTLKVMRRRCLEQIHHFRNMHRFLPALFQIEGFRVVEVPVRHHPRRHGKSKFGIGNRLWVGLADCRGVRWLRRRHLDWDIEERLE